MVHFLCVQPDSNIHGDWFNFRCKIYFYLEDDAVQVNEQKIDNSGIPQGLLTEQHLIVKELTSSQERNMHVCR